MRVRIEFEEFQAISNQKETMLIELVKRVKVLRTSVGGLSVCVSIYIYVNLKK